MKKKPRLNFWQIWNMSFGFLGIQFGLALQNANVSRIFQTFGADVHQISWFWLAAPITGLIVQPIIGHYSDNTWCRLGRRRPYFLAGAILASIALILMPNAPGMAAYIAPLYVAAGLLMIMDASINVSMEPFRALVADNLPSDQRTLGFSIQSLFIGIGAVVGSILPYALANWFNIGGSAESGEIPKNVEYSFYIGATVFIATIIWTVFRTKEYPPEQYNKFNSIDKEEKKSSLLDIFKDIAKMPTTMKTLGLVQFFSWFGLFGMWVFTTPAIAEHVYNASIDPDSPIYNPEAYNEAGNWVGVIFGVYNGVCAIVALLLPVVAKKTSRKFTHAAALVIGGIGMVSFYFIKTPELLVIPMIGVGVAWASILAMPYAILAGSIPPGKMGIYMGIFNFFIVIPQIINGIFGGVIVEYLYGGKAIYALVTAGVMWFIGAITLYWVKDEK